MKAFPEVNYVKPLGNGQSVMTISGGMDLRDYFAAQAMNAYLTEDDAPIDFTMIADRAYQMADAMMKRKEI